MDGADVSEDFKMLANFSLNMFSLLEAIVEKAVRPMAATPPIMGKGGTGNRPPVPPPKPDAKRQELVDVLAKADRTAVLHDANLGSVPVANRQKLCAALSAGIRAAALGKAESDGDDPAEAIRVTDDALSLVKDMTFLGQASKKANNPRRPELDHMTMPIKLEFEDRSARIHFERTVLARCNLRASMSLPKNVRKAQSKFHDFIRELYPGEITMVRTDTFKLQFTAFHKEDGGPKWLLCPEGQPIPLDVLNGETDVSPGGAAGGVPGVPRADEAATPMVVS
jgi:hypothetical protein